MPVQNPTKYELVIDLKNRQGSRPRHSHDRARTCRRGD
jgi:hypothetical protein